MFYLTESTNQKAASTPASDVELVPRLILEVRDSPSFPKGKTFQITPSGAKESKRQVIDGRTIIGSDSNSCDIVMNGDEDVGRMHCAIEFNTKEKRYQVRDLGEGNGTFMKIEDKLILHNSDIISFGDTHAGIVLTEQSTSLSLQVYEGPHADQEFTFAPSDSIVRIGRVRDCALQIDDKNLSRCHCFLSFHEATGWTVTDGDGNKRSANGTW